MKSFSSKVLATFLLLLISAASLFAQTDNLCPQNNVPTLPVNCGSSNYDIPQSYSVDNTANVSNTTTCVTTANNRRDGWFQFTATATTSTVTATVNSNTRNLAIAVYNGSCGAMTELGCVNNGGNGATEIVTFATSIGTTYFIRLIRINSGSTNNTIDGDITVSSPITNNNCIGAIPLTPSAVGGACNSICGVTTGATASTPATGCSGTANDDVWYSFTATQLSHVITVDGSSNFDPVIELLSGPCGAMSSLGCADLTNDGGIENLTYNNFTAGVTYYVRVYDSGNNIPGSPDFSICVTTPVIPTCPGSLGGGVVNVGSLPYTSTGRTTTGRGNDFTALNTLVCGNSNYYQGQDEVFIFTPSTSGNISITLTSTSNNVGIMLYNGCPFIGQGGVCVDNSQSSSGNQFMCDNVIAGNTYYLIVDRNSNNGISSYSITITAPTTGLPPGATCANAIPVTLPFTATSQSTLCKGNDYNNSSTGSCASLYESGEDMVYSLTVGGPQCISITLSGTSSNQAGFLLYENCPGSVGANCLGYVGGGNVTGNFSLPNAGTFYIIVDSWDPPSGVSYNINIAAATGAIPNDLPCNATVLPVGVNVNGDNSCSSGALEPAVPSCWSNGAVNTVWFRFTATSTSMIVKTFLGTLSNTQIAAYTGACNSLTQIAPTNSSCNDDISCGSNTVRNSQLTLNGLTIGQTYFVRVDGEDDMTGTFGILVADGTIGLPSIYGQDCSLPLPICQSTIGVANPGFSSYGNFCDFINSANCLSSGERSGSWYTIPINVAGNLEFDIVPNDWLGAPSTTSTDYDFAIWEIGASGLQCNQLNSTNPVRCNYSALGVTGLAGTGNSPGAYPGFNGSYESAIAVNPGEVYLLFVSNYTNSTAGFALNFTGVPDPLNYSAVPSSMTWLGGTNTSWGVSANWGACVIPDCSADAIISSSSINQPVITTNQSVNSVTINPGASLTINPGVTLSVCGDFTNFGQLITLPGSVVKFVGSGMQQISGSLTGANGFANLTMQKPSGTLLINTNIDIKENDSLKTGFFDSNSKDVRIGRNFYNADGSVTHVSPVPAGKYEFFGSVNQNFTNAGTDNIIFNDVEMDQLTNSALILGTGAFNDLQINGTLDLSRGKITTNAKQVYVLNPANGAVSNGNTTSYVEGNLRRALNNNATGIYVFPVGNAARGFQRATINFTSATQIPELLAYFTSWGAIPNGPTSNECTFANYALRPALNNGFWTFQSLSNNTTGSFDMTLNNINYTNASAPGGWTVMKRDPLSTGTWGLDGSCVLTSTIAATQRTSLVGFDADFATAQSASPLPIELLNFEAKVTAEGVLAEWTTATEINNDHFTIERSYDGQNFNAIGTVRGAGNSTQEKYYSFLDNAPGKGIIYYRLKQTDYDGQFTYSQAVAVKINEKVIGINVYPNPTHDVLNFQFEADGGDAIIKVIDMTGRVALEEKKNFKQGVVSSFINLKELANGVYYLTISGEDSTSKAWFIKK